VEARVGGGARRAVRTMGARPRRGAAAAAPQPPPIPRHPPVSSDAAPTPAPAPAAAHSRAGARVHDLMPAYYSESARRGGGRCGSCSRAGGIESGANPHPSTTVSEHFFPFDDFSRWLAHAHDSGHPGADPSYTKRRELCYTLDGDVFVRYQSAPTAAALRRAVLARAPAKIDVGPVYTADPARRAAYAGGAGFAPVERELVFDVDLTDYDDVRSCGDGGHICARCWPLMAAAVAVLDVALADDFGFKHRLWIFSGRRGVHCWVNDARARALTDEQRSSVAACLSIYKGVEDGVPRLALPSPTAPLHPAVDRALKLLAEAWTGAILPAQKLLDGSGTWGKVLAAVPDAGVVARLTARWAKAPTPAADDGGAVSLARWRELEAECAKAGRPTAADARNPVTRDAKAAIARAPAAAILACAYPRLDVEVSKKRNHLLKAPFCVHPKTGKVCVPFSPSSASRFDPDGVPTAAGLLDARDAAAAAGEAVGDGWEGPLAPALAAFREHLAALAVDDRAALSAKAARDAADGAAAGLAW